MEELQDAIEDAQYVNAIASQDDGPRPVLAWEVPSEEELAQWKKRIRDSPADETLGEPFGLDWTLSSAIGLFLFSSFLKDDCNDYVRINFCEEVIRWKRLRGRNRIERAKQIIDKYLKPPTKEKETGKLILPKKTEIVEYDLARPVPQIGAEDIQALCAANLDESNCESCVGINGSVLQQINAIMAELEVTRMPGGAAQDPASSIASLSLEEEPLSREDNIIPGATKQPEESKDSFGDSRQQDPDDLKQKQEPKQNPNNTQNVEEPKAGPGRDEWLQKQLSAMNIDHRQSRARKYLPDDLFDRAESIVMESQRRQYWDRFNESEQHKKMDNFHWYRDRGVIPEDFFILRVLGRGGFGLVTGKNFDFFHFPS